MNEIEQALAELFEKVDSLRDCLLPLEKEIERLYGKSMCELGILEKIRIAQLLVAANKKCQQ